MKVSITVDGLECKAESDYTPSSSLYEEDRENINSAIFSRLCTEMERVAFKLIEEKYGNEKRKC